MARVKPKFFALELFGGCAERGEKNDRPILQSGCSVDSGHARPRFKEKPREKFRLALLLIQN
jgi:hypothetical protein